MTDPKLPRLVPVGDGYEVTWESQGVTLVFDRIRETAAGKIHAEMTAAGPLGHMLWGQYDLGNSKQRADAAADLARKDDSRSWAAALEWAWVEVVRAYRRPPEAIDLADVEYEDNIPYLLYPFLLEGETNFLYGDGGSLKSYLALFLGIACRTGMGLPGGLFPTKQVGVLYVDFETRERSVWVRLNRVARGFGLHQRPRIIYLRPEGTLVDSIAHIRRLVAKHDIGLVIIDSIAYAISGDIFKPEAVNPAMVALRSLGDVTRLVLAHVSRESARAAGVQDPYGSVFFRNGQRNGWQVKRVTEQESPVVDLALYHGKHNDDMGLKPKGFRVTFDSADKEVRIEEKDVRTMSAFAEDLSPEEQVLELLSRQSPLDYQAIADRLGLSLSKVKRVVLKLEEEGRVVNENRSQGGAGNRARWAPGKTVQPFTPLTTPLVNGFSNRSPNRSGETVQNRSGERLRPAVGDIPDSGRVTSTGSRDWDRDYPF
jgi:hypothetical protein